MNILYLSCHEILEEIEIRLFTEMRHNVISLGAFLTNSVGTGKRSPIEGLYKNDHLQRIGMVSSKENIHEELLTWADIVIMMHNSAPLNGAEHPQAWLSNNWDKFKKSKKPIIWRSIGQSTKHIENSLQKFRREGLKIVRYSPKEQYIPDYVGEDVIIRFSVDPNEYQGYVGSIPQIVNISQAMFGSKNVKSRGDHMSKQIFEKVVEGFNWKIFGPDNEAAQEHNGGILPFEDLKAMLKMNRLYLYTGTRPASYTLAFIEAFATGIPIVSIGPVHGNEIYNQKTFEVPELIGQSGIAGFWSDSVDELREYCKTLLDDHALAKRIGQQGRLRAIQFFGKDAIKSQWESFFNTL